MGRRTAGAEPLAAGRTYLLVIGDREALAWVLSSGRMAFPDFRRVETQALAVGDRLLIYTTRGCFKNPTRDRGRVIGEAVVTSAVAALAEPVELAGRSFPVGCRIAVQTLSPLHTGAELAELVPELNAFPDLRSWSVRLRRPLLALSPSDARRLRRALAPHTEPVQKAVEAYLRWLPHWASPTRG